MEIKTRFFFLDDPEWWLYMCRNDKNSLSYLYLAHMMTDLDDLARLLRRSHYHIHNHGHSHGLGLLSDPYHPISHLTTTIIPHSSPSTTVSSP